MVGFLCLLVTLAATNTLVSGEDHSREPERARNQTRAACSQLIGAESN